MVTVEPTKPLQSIEYWCQRSEAGEKAGDYLEACDSALLGLEQHPSDRELQYRAVLALSRAGANKRASQLWAKYALERPRDASVSGAQLEENIAALGARLDREAAFAANPAQRREKLKAAAARYELVYRRTDSTFPGINAAVLHELSGDTASAKALATRIVKQCENAAPQTTEDAYQLAADRATANLLLGRLGDAQTAIAEAARLAGKASAIASTRKQLYLICDQKGIDPAVFSPLKNRSVIHYKAPMVAADVPATRFPADDNPRLAANIAREVAERDVGYGYGSLASAAELLIVEALLRRGAEVNVVLPFAFESFRSDLVTKAGPAWLARFDDCVARSKSTQATDGDYADDEAAFSYGSRLAMGMAMLKAQNLSANIAQLLVRDRRQPGHAIASWSDAEEWKQHGLETIILDAGETLVHAAGSPTGNRSAVPPRKLLAIMFGDFEHFSRLKDRQMLSFYDHVMRCVAQVLARYDNSIVARNTWGDGIYVVLDDIVSAAHSALEIQSQLTALDLRPLGLPSTLALRLGLHAGAVFEVEDPILKSIGFTGTHISRTARLQPNTPAGEVYVTEAFAALLALSRPTDLSCDYVGMMNAPKGYGRLRTYLLRSK
jgi:adenylate cyclase